MSEPTIAAGVVRAFMDFAVAKGASRDGLAACARIDPAELGNQDNRIPFAKYVTLVRAAKQECKDPALALHFGESTDAGELSISSLITGFSETVAESFALMNRYAALTAEVEVDGGESGDRFQVMRTGDMVWIVDMRKDPNDFPELTESTFARIVCLSRRFTGDRPFVRRVHVTHPEPAYRAEYERIFRTPVVFGSDKNALLIDDWWLTQKPPFSSGPALRVLTAHAEELLEQLKSSKSMRGRVESSLIPILHTGDARIEIVASKLGLSRQTLFRKLKAEGVTFEKVLDELRHQLALHYLKEKRFSVNETAYWVGFSDPAAFSRAFKRWTGSSPSMMLNDPAKLPS